MLRSFGQNAHRLGRTSWHTGHALVDITATAFHNWITRSRKSMRPQIPEKKPRGQRHWVGKEGQQQAVDASQRINRPPGDAALRVDPLEIYERPKSKLQI
jgi:hypothetical protein